MALSYSDFRKAVRFAAAKHKDQKENGTEFPYLVHLSNVAAEVFFAYAEEPDFDLLLATIIAYLHDTLEDTETTVEELTAEFGEEVAAAVKALTKSKDIEDKEQRLKDSLARIRISRKEVGIVKLADRITNLDAPNLPWADDKRKRYMEGSNLILAQLGHSHEYLAARLKLKILDYVAYVVTGN
jgi:(p)ppGpp synthase/HD superfamily hydrolase